MNSSPHDELLDRPHGSRDEDDDQSRSGDGGESAHGRGLLLRGRAADAEQERGQPPNQIPAAATCATWAATVRRRPSAGGCVTGSDVNRHRSDRPGGRRRQGLCSAGSSATPHGRTTAQPPAPAGPPPARSSASPTGRLQQVDQRGAGGPALRHGEQDETHRRAQPTRPGEPQVGREPPKRVALGDRRSDQDDQAQQQDPAAEHLESRGVGVARRQRRRPPRRANPNAEGVPPRGRMTVDRRDGAVARPCTPRVRARSTGTLNVSGSPETGCGRPVWCGDRRRRAPRLPTGTAPAPRRRSAGPSWGPRRASRPRAVRSAHQPRVCKPGLRGRARASTRAVTRAGSPDAPTAASRAPSRADRDGRGEGERGDPIAPIASRRADDGGVDGPLGSRKGARDRPATSAPEGARPGTPPPRAGSRNRRCLRARRPPVDPLRRRTARDLERVGAGAGRDERGADAPGLLGHHEAARALRVAGRPRRVSQARDRRPACRPPSTRRPRRSSQTRSGGLLTPPDRQQQRADGFPVVRGRTSGVHTSVRAVLACRATPRQPGPRSAPRPPVGRGVPARRPGHRSHTGAVGAHDEDVRQAQARVGRTVGRREDDRPAVREYDLGHDPVGGLDAGQLPEARAVRSNGVEVGSDRTLTYPPATKQDARAVGRPVGPVACRSTPRASRAADRPRPRPTT